MGRKVEMKKIENVTRRQVTFSKRRSSLIKKAHEISVCCEVDVAFVTFSPSGRLTKFCSQKRIEDVLERYVSLPPEKRYPHIKNVEEKQEKLKLLDLIKGDQNKLHYLNTQIKRSEQQIKKYNMGLEIIEASLRDYETYTQQDPSLAQLLWSEKNLRHTLQQVTDRKRLLLANNPQSSYGHFTVQMERERQGGAPSSYNFNGNELNWAMQNPTTNQLLMQLDPWISPYSSRVRENILHDLLDRPKGVMISNGVLDTSKNYSCKLPIAGLQSINQSGILSSLPGAQISPTPSTYAPMQRQAVIGDPIIPILPNKRQGMLDHSSKGMLGHNGTVGVQQYSTQTLGHHRNYLNRQDGVAPVTHFRTNPQKWTWFAGNFNPTQNLNGFTPLNSDRNLSPLGYDPFFSTSTVTTTSYNTNYKNNNSNNNNNNNGGCDANEKPLAARGQVDPPVESPKDLLLTNNLSIEAVMGNDALSNAGNQENGCLEWDGFLLAENLNLQDFDFLFE